MAAQDIIQNMLEGLGQSQQERIAPELAAHFADIDERSPRDLLLFLKRLAPFVNYYSGTIDAPAGTWENFFSSFDESTVDALLATDDGRLAPHLALLASFLELYAEPRSVLNTFTGNHLDFHFRDVLHFAEKPATPDRVHLVLGLKKGVASALIDPANIFSAGKDATGVEMLYAPTTSTVVNTSSVASIRSFYFDAASGGTIRYAPIANSSNGLGGALDAADPSWYGFGNASLPAAEIGFAIASPLFRLAEGTRVATITLSLDRAPSLDESALESAFEFFATGEKGWIGPLLPTVTLDDATITFALSIPSTESAVVDYSAKLHGYEFAATAPIIQALLPSNGSGVGYSALKGLVVESVAITVEAAGITSLSLESDAGTLDAKKAFLPFGPQPTKGSRFMIAYPEALAKKLSEVRLLIDWKDVPDDDLSTHYAGYKNNPPDNSDFIASASFTDGAGTQMGDAAAQLFDSDDATDQQELIFTAVGQGPSYSSSYGSTLFALYASGSSWASHAVAEGILARPLYYGYQSTESSTREGFITLTLNSDFLHSTYRKKYVENVLAFTKSTAATITLLNEPYTPTVQSLSLSYKAYSDEVEISSTSVDAFANPDVQFFHQAGFGPMREHGYQRSLFGFLSSTNVTLLPDLSSAGELLIGISGAAAGDSVSLLMQVAEGSADPEAEREEIAWQVLCDNYWRPFDEREIALDTTNDLLTSGIVRFVIPTEATTTNSALPSGMIWIKGSVANDVDAVARLIDIRANALEAVFVDNGNDPLHLETSLPAGSITKLKNGHASVKSVEQPYGSFGGKPVETAEAFHTRASERLRHKNRCITPWDYERVVLQAFPNVHRVKCIPHAKEGNWLAPGHVMLVVVPDLRNKNAIDPLQPRVDADTLDKIAAHVAARAGMGVKAMVKNPRYQKIRLDFKVRFRAGYEFNFYRAALEQAVIEALSPWAFDVEREISFGGIVYRSALLDLIEELEYVDYVTDFRMYSYSGDVVDPTDLDVARPMTPDTILVSGATHVIGEVE